jgi:hypothetical protein
MGNMPSPPPKILLDKPAETAYNTDRWGYASVQHFVRTDGKKYIPRMFIMKKLSASKRSFPIL